MSNLRVFWIIWCSMWAFGWLLFGWLLILGWVMVPVSLLAILIPVGASPRPQLPPAGHPAWENPPRCCRCGAPPEAHPGGWCPRPPEPATMILPPPRAGDL